jgi:hypothetical protein
MAECWFLCIVFSHAAIGQDVIDNLDRDLFNLTD